MLSYYAAGRTNAATDAAANAVVAQLWNPSTAKILEVFEVSLFKTAAGGNEDLAVVRTSARGATPGSTITPTIASDVDRLQAPPSGAVIETSNFATEPTIDGVALGKRWMAPNIAASGIVWAFGRPIRVLPGAGLAIVQLTTALAVPVCIVGYGWDE